MSRPGSFTPHSAICNAPMRGVPPRVHPPKPYTDVRFRVGASPKTAATPDFPRRQSGESGLPPRNAPPAVCASGSACRRRRMAAVSVRAWGGARSGECRGDSADPPGNRAARFRQGGSATAKTKG